MHHELERRSQGAGIARGRRATRGLLRTDGVQCGLRRRTLAGSCRRSSTAAARSASARTMRIECGNRERIAECSERQVAASRGSTAGPESVVTLAAPSMGRPPDDSAPGRVSASSMLSIMRVGKALGVVARPRPPRVSGARARPRPGGWREPCLASCNAELISCASLDTSTRSVPALRAAALVRFGRPASARSAGRSAPRPCGTAGLGDCPRIFIVQAPIDVHLAYTRPVREANRQPPPGALIPLPGGPLARDPPARPATRTSKCRCGPVDRPVLPTRPTSVPVATSSPAFTETARQVRIARLGAVGVIDDDTSGRTRPASPANDTVPAAAAGTSVP